MRRVRPIRNRGDAGPAPVLPGAARRGSGVRAAPVRRLGVAPLRRRLAGAERPGPLLDRRRSDLRSGAPAHPQRRSSGHRGDPSGAQLLDGRSPRAHSPPPRRLGTLPARGRRHPGGRDARSRRRPARRPRTTRDVRRGRRPGVAGRDGVDVSPPGDPGGRPHQCRAARQHVGPSGSRHAGDVGGRSRRAGRAPRLRLRIRAPTDAVATHWSTSSRRIPLPTVDRSPTSRSRCS